LNEIPGFYSKGEEGLTIDVESSADSPYSNRQCRTNNFISVPNRNASGINERLNLNYHSGNCSKDILAKDKQERSSGRRHVKQSLTDRRVAVMKAR